MTLPVEDNIRDYLSTKPAAGQDRKIFDPVSLKRLLRYVNLARSVLDNHIEPTVAEKWKGKFNNAANRMLTAYDKCGLGREDRNTRSQDAIDQETEQYEARVTFFRAEVLKLSYI